MRNRRPRLDLSVPRPLGMLVADALRLFAAYPALFLALALVVVAPYQLIVLAVTGASPLGQSSAKASTAITLLLLDFALVVPFVSALHVRAVAAIARGEQPRLLTALSEGVRVLPVVAAAQIIADIAIVIGLFAFVIPGIVVAVRVAVVAQTAAMEGTDWMGAIRRGAELTLGSAFHVLGVLLVTSFVTYGLTVAGAAAAGSHAGAGQVLLGIAIDTVTRAFTALTTAVLYFELRGRRAQPGSPTP